MKTAPDVLNVLLAAILALAAVAAVWLIVNALFVVWRILVTSSAETRDRSIRKMPKVADL